ncbi:PepSY-associated TM helix domain-containing protein [Gimesia sp.]|uniref:PepSY-associated TM helix domain-containing protein n=1 Tax=Gimesia sp. TaxID=2024833 RepID=UPI003A8F4B03
MSNPSAPPRRKRSWYATSAALFRWLHIYISMLGFTMLIFFAVTGITLNHPTWFGASEQSVRDASGTLPEELAIVAHQPNAEAEASVSASAPFKVDKLNIAEWLRSEHGLKGRVREFEVNEYDIMVVFKGPGYSADIFIDPTANQYTLTETTTGVISVLNDLHKGRDSGLQWSWVIDVSAIVTILMSVSGFGLLFYLKKRRTKGLLTALAGTILLVAAWALWVP